MHAVMNENVIVKEYEFINPLIHKTDSIIDNCSRDCHNKYFLTFDHVCEYDIQLTNNSNNQMITLIFPDKSMTSYELNEKLTVVRGSGIIFNQLNKLRIIIYSNLSHIIIHYYLKLPIPIMHRQFFKKIAQNPEYIQTHCNKRRNLFHFACGQLYLNNKV